MRLFRRERPAELNPDGTIVMEVPKKLGLVHAPRVRTEDPKATREQQHQAIIDLRKEVKEKFYA